MQQAGSSATQAGAPPRRKTYDPNVCTFDDAGSYYSLLGNMAIHATSSEGPFL